MVERRGQVLEALLCRILHRHSRWHCPRSHECSSPSAAAPALSALVVGVSELWPGTSAQVLAAAARGSSPVFNTG